jgi:hypothetical protein
MSSAERLFGKAFRKYSFHLEDFRRYEISGFRNSRKVLSEVELIQKLPSPRGRSSPLHEKLKFK